MGQAGSQPAPGAPVLLHRRAHTLPHEPPRLAPKVLPSIKESPKLRSTNNGAILLSGGTISGRRASTHQQETSRASHAQNMHMEVYRSRSAGAGGDPNDVRARERNPLHRSHTNFELRYNDGGMKRFGSEPDLRIEEEQKRPKCSKHFRKKYRAPPPPCVDIRDGSSPDSSDGNAKVEPQKKMRLFKTRNETKKCSRREPETKNTQYRRTDYPADNQDFERRFQSPYRDRDHFKYPDSKEMAQTPTSLEREAQILQTTRQDYKKRIDRVGGCRAKTSKNNDQTEAWKTPLLNRDFRHSERFRRNDSEIPILRREKTFDATLMSSGRESESPRIAEGDKLNSNGDDIKKKTSPLTNNIPLRKSLPSLLTHNIDDKEEFRAELKKATSKIRNELMSKVKENKNIPSQNEKPVQRPSTAKSIVARNKVSESSPNLNKYKNTKDETKNKIVNNRRPFSRANDEKPKLAAPVLNKNNNSKVSNGKLQTKPNSKAFPDRGQASGKESTPEHSPTRKQTAPVPVINHNSKEKTKAPPVPSKQFYFGMIEPKQSVTNDNLKDFPGLGSPIIEEISDFHIIEKKLLAYRDEDEEFENFNAKLRANCKMKNLSSESALSSDGSEGEGSDSSLGIALRLRPTLPKKQPAMPRFSPAAAWKQLASLDAHLAAEIQPLAVETKVSIEPTGGSSPRSDQSADKSGDSGISGDHANSDPRLDSPTRPHPDASPDTWTPQQDLGDSSSDGVGSPRDIRTRPDGLVTYSARGQPFSLSLPREPQDKGKQIQQGFNSLQKLRKSVSGALGAALGSRKFDLEHEPMLEEPERNWFLTKSAPNSLSNPLMFPAPRKLSGDEDLIQEESPSPSDKDEPTSWRPSASYLSWGGHVMYLPPAADMPRQPLSLLGPLDRPVRSKSSGELEMAARAARAARAGQFAGEMRERERSASPGIARAVPARVESTLGSRKPLEKSRGKRFTFQSTVRQLERRRLAEKLSKEADLKEQQRKTELEAMMRVEEEFQRKRAREKANIRQQLRLVSGAASLPHSTNHKTRDEPDGSMCRESPSGGERGREGRVRHSNTSSETSGRSKSTTPIRSIELSEWRVGGEARQYRDWGGVGAGGAGVGGMRSLASHAHPPACARMPIATPAIYNATETEAFSGSPRSDNYRLEFARGVARSPRTPRPPRLLTAPRSPSTSGSELSLRQPIRISREITHEEAEEDAIVPTLRPSGPTRAAVVSH